MPKNQGLLIVFDETQRNELLRKRTKGPDDTFSDALSIPDWKIGSLEVGLLAFSPLTIDAVAFLKRGKQVVTAKARVEFSEFVSLRPVPISQIESILNKQIQSYVIRSSRGAGGTIPGDLWSDIINVLKKLRPEAKNEIDRLISLRSYAGYELHGGISKTLVQEREALGSALDIFGGSNQLREKVLRSWAPPAGAVTSTNEETMQATLTEGPKGRFSFLSQLSEQYRNEEASLQHDLFNWMRVPPVHILGISTFIQGDRRLDVVYANKNALEKTLGVDLIYYHQEYELFALVQYKMMRKEGDIEVYRPDNYLETEIKRMDDFVEQHGLDCEMRCHTDFRMNCDGFLIKLIPSIGLRPASGELIQGLYLTREYLKFLLGPYGSKGGRDGRVLTFENTPRHLTNSDFVHQIRKGWLGMRGAQTAVLKSLIDRFVRTGRAVLVAYEKGLYSR